MQLAWRAAWPSGASAGRPRAGAFRELSGDAAGALCARPAGRDLRRHQRDGGGSRDHPLRRFVARDGRDHAGEIRRTGGVARSRREMDRGGGRERAGPNNGYGSDSFGELFTIRHRLTRRCIPTLHPSCSRPARPESRRASCGLRRTFCGPATMARRSTGIGARM